MEESLKKQSEEILQGAPTIELAPEKTIEPVEVEMREYDPKQDTIQTASEARGTTTQTFGGSKSRSSVLNPTSEVPYMGGSTIPGQDVSARARDISGYEGNPLFLESMNRFVPVKPYKIHLPSIQQEFTVDTIDPQKIAYTLATLYQGVPKTNFYGYQYVAPELEETMWDASTWAKTRSILWPTAKGTGKQIIGGIGRKIAEAGVLAEEIAYGRASPAPLLKQMLRAVSPVYRGQTIAELVFGDDDSGKPGFIKRDQEEKQQIRDTINAALALKTVDGRLQTDDSTFAKSFWNEAHMYSQNATKELDAVLKENQLINPTIGAEIVQAIPQSLAAMSSTMAFGPILGPSIRYFAYNESIANSLLEKGLTYEEASKRANKGSLISTAIEAATAGIGAGLANRFTKDYVANTIGKALKSGAISFVPKAGMEMIGETYQEKVESYFAQDVGLETFTTLGREDLVVAVSALIADSIEIASDTRRAYVEGREKQKTLELKKKYDEEFKDKYGNIISLGDAYRKVFVGMGYSEEEADIIFMQAIANGPESIEHFLRDAVAGQLDRLMSGELSDIINGVEQTLRPASKDPTVFAREELAKLDAKFDEQFKYAGEHMDQETINAIKAMVRSLALQWSYETGNPLSEFALVDYLQFANEEYMKRATGISSTGFSEYNPSTKQARVVLPTDKKKYDELSGMAGYTDLSAYGYPGGQTPVVGHEYLHGLLYKLASDAGLTNEQFFNFVTTINEFGMKKAFPKRAAGSSMDKPVSQQAQEFASEDPQKVRDSTLKGNRTKYTDPRDFNEWAAQAFSHLGKDADKMLGMESTRAWSFVSKLNRLLSAMNDVTPLSTGIQNWLAGFESFVAENSERMLELVKSKGAENLQTAIGSLINGNGNAINWKGITWNDLKELLELAERPLNAEAMKVTQAILDKFDEESITKLTKELWDSAWAVDEQGEVVPNSSGETNEANTETDIDEVELDDLLNPFDGIISEARPLFRGSTARPESDGYKTIVSKDGKEFVFDNSLEGIGGTGISRDSHEGYDTIIINMPVDDYLSAASPLNDHIKDSQLKFFDESIEQGKSFAMPFLLVDIDGDSKTMTVYGHEGRNRAHALKRAGFETIPVIIKSPDLKPVRDGVSSELSETIKRDPKGIVILSQKTGEPAHTISSENLLNQNDEQAVSFARTGSEYTKNNFLNAFAQKEKEVKQPKTAFEKQMERKVDGRTLEEDLDRMIELVKNTPRKRGFATWMSERRGIIGLMFSLGGSKAVKDFDFAGKRQAFRDIYDGRIGKFRKEVINTLFNGSSLEYSRFITDFQARNIETTVFDKVTGQTKTIKVSKDIIAQAMLSFDQERWNGPVRVLATFRDYHNLVKHMTPTDLAFKDALRKNLETVSTKYLKRLKGDSVGHIIKNYYPLVSWKGVSEDGPIKTLSFFSRKDTTSPVGIIGAVEVFGRYHGRLAGAESEFFTEVRRLGEMLDYPKYAATDGMVEKDAQRLALKSRQFRELVSRQVNIDGLRELERFIDYVKGGSVTADLSKGFFTKLSQTITPALLGGKLKNFFTNMTQAAYWLGAPTKDAPTYWAEVAGVFSQKPTDTYREFMEIGERRNGVGFFKNRKENIALNEFVSRARGAGDESLIKDAAIWLAGKDLTKPAEFAEFVSWFAGKATKIAMSPTTGGDIAGNMFFAVAYRRALIKENMNKGMKENEAIIDADNRVIDFVLTRESSSNLAVKAPGTRWLNRNIPLVGGVTAFTGETVASFGALGQSIQGWKMGEITGHDAAKEALGIMAGHLAYRAIQSGLFGAIISGALGALDDEEKEFILSSFSDQIAQEVMDGIAGPYAAIVNPVLLSLVNDRTYGISIPLLSESSELFGAIDDLIKDAWKGDELETNDIVKAIGGSLSLSGAFPALENIINSVRGAYLSVFGETPAERKKGRYMATGRTEGFAEKAAGMKNKKKKNVDKYNVVK